MQLQSYDDIRRDIKNNFIKCFNKSNPFNNNSFLGILLNTVAYGLYSINNSINYLLKQVFANTADYEHLKLQAVNRIDELNETSSSGSILINGDKDTNINSGEIFTLKNSNLSFKLLDDTTIYEIIYNKNDIDNINSYEKIATIKFKNYINLIESMNITIENASETSFNGTWSINKIIDRYTIQITINNSENLNEDLINSNIKIKVNIGIGKCESILKGTNNNLPAFTILESSNANIDNVGINYNGLSGGRDKETKEEYRDRYLKFLREPQAYFNENWIKYKILNNFTKVTRVTIDDNDDNITIYVINNNTTDLLVDNDTIVDINTYLFKKYIPINLDSSKFEVKNPNKQNISFTINNIKPSANNYFKELIKKEVEQYCLDLEIGSDLKIDLLKGYIYNIRDYENNYYVDNFDISLNTDVNINIGNILIADVTVN